VHGVSDELKDAQSAQDIALARRFNSKIAATLAGYSDADVFARLERIRAGAVAEAGGSAKLAEFDAFASGSDEIGQNTPTAKLYAQTLSRDAWGASAARVDVSAIKNIVAVHRLREVSCLYGFTRFEAAPTSADGELEDIQLSLRGAPLALDADWLPAVEQFGERIFIHSTKGLFGSGSRARRRKIDTTSWSPATATGARDSAVSRRRIPGRPMFCSTACRMR
jgi:hypothetical protein